jgi:LPXTG-site transpeptidase (sortase) family protein
MENPKNLELPQGASELYGHLGVSSEPTIESQLEPKFESEPLKTFNPGHVPTNIDEALAETADIGPINTSLASTVAAPKDNNKQPVSKAILTGIKKLIPYVAVFAVGIAAFAILFTNVSVKNLFNFNQTPAVQQAQAEVVPANQKSAYNDWINSYFYDVSNPEVLDPNYDYSGNGLTNYQKFLLGLNPTKQDTAGIGITDSQALIAGIDPLTGQPMTDAQKSLVESAIDLEALSNKIALSTLANSNSNSNSDPAPVNTQPAVTENSETSLASAAQAANAQSSNTPSNITGQGDVPPINTSINGELDIPSLKITVPLVWGATPDAVDTDLQSGVVHYPGTALPGEIGTAYISGHSSNYVWAKGSYNKIFATLGNLKKDSSFTITATSTNGEKLTFHYVVTASGTFSPTDQKQFASIGKSTVGLSTCWPVGTSSNRLVVFGQLTQVEQGSN